MQIKLLSCDAARPDKRAITKTIETYGGADSSLARELTDILLDGSSVEIEVGSKTMSSAFRALRKYGIDYEIMD